jgi:hypothetical protein
MAREVLGLGSREDSALLQHTLKLATNNTCL